MIPVYLLLGTIVLILIWSISTYNKFISLGRHLDEAWSGIAVQLKRRHDLVPNLVNTVAGYATHEKGLLEEITRLRGQAASIQNNQPSSSILESEHALSQALGKLLMLAENYPELRANQNFIALHQTLSDIEEQIQMARRYYNGTVRNYNILVESFPSMIIAGFFTFKTKNFFELDNQNEAAVPTVTF